MAGLLYLGARQGLALMHALQGALQLPAVKAPLRRPDLPRLAAVILFGGVLGPLLLMFGLARTDAAAGVAPAEPGRLGDHGPRSGALLREGGGGRNLHRRQ